MSQPHVGIFRGGSFMQFEDLMALTEEPVLIFESFDDLMEGDPFDIYKGNKDAVAAALKGDLDGYLVALGMDSERLKRWDTAFMKGQMQNVADFAKADNKEGIAAPSKSAVTPLKKVSKKSKAAPRYKGPIKRGFGYVSLAKSLKQLRGKKLYKIIDPGILGVIAKKIDKARPAKMGKRGASKTRKVGMSSGVAKKIAMWVHTKLLKRYPFSEKKAGAPEDRDSRIMNKALYTRGLSLILKDLLSKVGGQNAEERKAERLKAKSQFDDFKKKLRLVEWAILRDLEYLGESTYREFMILINDCEALVESAINGLNSLEECRDDGAVDHLEESFDFVMLDIREPVHLKIAKELEDKYFGDVHFNPEKTSDLDFRKWLSKIPNNNVSDQGSDHKFLMAERARRTKIWMKSPKYKKMKAKNAAGLKAANRKKRRKKEESVWIDDAGQIEESLPFEKPQYADDFAAGFKRGKAAVARNPNVSLTDVERSYKRVSNKHGSWWKNGYSAAIDIANGASAMPGAKIAKKMGLVESVWIDDDDREYYGEDAPEDVIDEVRPDLSTGAKSKYVFPNREAWPIGDRKHGRIALKYIVAGRGKAKDWAKVLEAVLDRYPDMKVDHADLVKKAKSMSEGMYADEDYFNIGEDRVNIGYALGEGLTAQSLDNVNSLLNERLNPTPQERPIFESNDYHKLGAQLQHWAQGDADPIFRAGARLFSGRKPWRRDVCDAIESLQKIMMTPQYADHEVELRGIVSRLRNVCLG